jgi:hypothetical protein
MNKFGLFTVVTETETGNLSANRLNLRIPINTTGRGTDLDF